MGFLSEPETTLDRSGTTCALNLAFCFILMVLIQVNRAIIIYSSPWLSKVRLIQSPFQSL